MDKVFLANDARKFAVLGDMLELGNYTEEGHRLVGRKVYEAGIDKLIAVGEKARDIARGAQEAGMKQDNIFHFHSSNQNFQLRVCFLKDVNQEFCSLFYVLLCK